MERRLPFRFSRIARVVAAELIVGYQHLLSPRLGRNCRFIPSCSQYALEAIRRYGVFKGSWLGLRRLGRCHPFSPPGLDPLPPEEAG